MVFFVVSSWLYLGQTDCLALLLLLPSATPNTSDSKGETPLQAAAISSSGTACVTLLLHAKAHPDLEDNIGEAALERVEQHLQTTTKVAKLIARLKSRRVSKLRGTVPDDEP